MLHVNKYGATSSIANNDARGLPQSKPLVPRLARMHESVQPMRGRLSSAVHRRSHPAHTHAPQARHILGSTGGAATARAPEASASRTAPATSRTCCPTESAVRSNAHVSHDSFASMVFALPSFRFCVVEIAMLVCHRPRSPPTPTPPASDPSFSPSGGDDSRRPAGRAVPASSIVMLRSIPGL